METGSSGSVPNFGTVVRRERLINVFVGQRPSLTLVCAPAGYGKSVLSAQLAEAGTYAEVLWISDLDQHSSGGRLVLRAASAIAAASSPAASLDAHPVTSHDDAMLSIGLSLKNRAGERLCLVLDGCSCLEGLSPLQELAEALRSLTSPLSAIIATCRTTPCEAPLDPRSVWAVESHDLRFTGDEVLSLLAIAGPSQVHATPEHYLARFGGHPALTSLMVRHAGLDEERTPPRDLVWYVDVLVRDLSPEALRLLYGGALLKEDRLDAWIACLDVHETEPTWEEIRALAPLLVLSCDVGGDQAFRIHDVLRDAVCRLAATLGDGDELALIRVRVLSYLASTGAYSRMLWVIGCCPPSEFVHWFCSHGASMLRFCGPDAMMRAMKSIPPTVVAGSAELLLLRARVLREQERYAEAQKSASLAASLAEAEGDRATRVRAILLVARLSIDLGRWETLAAVLAQLEEEKTGLDRNSSGLLDAYAAVAESQAGNMHRALARADKALQSMDSIDDLGSDDAVFTVNGLAAVLGVHSGRWAEAATLLAVVANRADLSPSQRFLVRANLAVCRMETGSLREAQTLLDEVIAAAEASGLRHLALYAYGTRSGVFYARSEDERGRKDYECCERLMQELGQQDLRVAEHIQAAMNLRASGQVEQALSLTEEAELIVRRGTAGYLVPDYVVKLEMAACLLSMGDEWGAGRVAEEVRARPDVATPGAIRADMIQAETTRLSGEVRRSIDILRAHRDYLVTGSANRLVALYIRAFPGLLGVLTSAIGAENIPLRMLLMIPIETLERGIQIAGRSLSDRDTAMLIGRRGASLLSTRSSSLPTPPSHPCYVKLFGGLEVTTEAGVVGEGSWRKRKARLMFITLVLRQHQDVPRDVLLERLWPDMDEEHAKRNFYVTWSTMKRALACGGAPSEAGEFVQCSGGVCRAGRQVRSDLDDFDEAVAALRMAAASGDADSAIREARRLVHIYRGELLPGDLYEEWFAEVRERTKHDFCDAMMSAATLAEGRGEAEVALLFLRRASAADPWREDVYQSMMRCQVNAGQRSRAIETYLSCRSRLTEDLGIDPSVETTRLYQAVLALENDGNCG